MDKKKKNEMRIIKKNDSNKQDYTFVSNDNFLNNTKNNEFINNEIKSGNKPNNRIEKKIHSKKVDNKGRKILGKSM
jgi:hypothetical protein